MIELVIGITCSVVLGVVWALAVRALPHGDPARKAAQQLSKRLAKRRGVRVFLRRRMDPNSATGLALLFALVGVVIAGIVLGVFAAMIRSNSGVVNVDAHITNWAALHSTPVTLRVWGWITQAGGPIGTAVVTIAAIGFAMRARERWSVALFLVIVTGGQAALDVFVKFVVGRVRPDVPPFAVLPGASFPSGHATAAAATWAAVALVLGRRAPPWVHAVLSGTAVGIAVAVAFSRVFLGAHWTSDVIGGLILGWTWFAICAVAFGGRLLRPGRPADEAAATPTPAGRGAPGGIGPSR